MSAEPALHEVRTSGAVLRGELHLCENPSDSDATTVVIRTPYDASAHRPIARAWNDRGYHCLVQDVRGRYRSTGDWDPYAHEESDGAATVDAVVADPKLGAEVLVFGASYAAHCALEAARSRRGCVTGVIALVPALGLYETAYAGDVVRHRDRIGWWEQHGFGRRSVLGLTEPELDVRAASAAMIGPLAAAENWDWDQRRLCLWRRLWSSDPLDLHERYLGCTMPLLVVSGQFDFFDSEARSLTDAWTGAATFRTGPWGHQLLTGITDPEQRARARRLGSPAEFIDRWLTTLAVRSTDGGPR
ncbi:CocE/NonD family hydrolase [Rhodococcoides kyotonense]|uniref:Xaa-Pro dipeptidyl-peptidase-like domain-containing protein n=1 Tax=Rhodococcoides kyotonense TaxID=398843 RepID=A0A239H2P8_9NOCA|nr:CocE/NonD family hydrolase [Rhodococcus kyotonensis]SNS75415.1 hypothetical protein SAMN05421642_10553 [Rhodococcus kyotonensis]